MFENPILAQAVEDLKNGCNQEYWRGPWGFDSENLTLLKVMERAGVEKENPVAVYCTIKTGRILTENNMHLLTKADIREWERYATEYRRKAKKTLTIS